ncbi:hypothetical protein C0J52_18312 [Blattella germanica]|nr:hypothetical protein C0J52_18312 [Blattella germanica]
MERFLIFTSILPGVRTLYGAGEILCQQDGAPAHCHLAVRAFLDDNMQEHWIGPIESPHLTPVDSYLWGTLKDQVYRRKSYQLKELHQEITAARRS